MRLALVLALLAGGCGHLLPGGARCPSSGGPVWRELRSAHFSLLTDLDDDAGARWIADLERLQAAVIVALTGAAREVPGRLRVVVPGNVETYLDLAPDNTIGFFVSDDLLEEPTVVIQRGARQVDPETLAHELAHYVSFRLFPRHPRWFEEGLAQFAETVGSPDPRYHHKAGAVSRLLRSELGQVGRIPLHDLFAWRNADEGTLEVWAWLLYHCLWSERPAQFADYQRRLLADESLAQAWAGAFPEFDPARPRALEALEALLDQHRRLGRFDGIQVESASDPAFVTVSFSAAQVHVLLVDVRRRWQPNGRPSGIRDDRLNLTRQQLRFALEDDPGEPIAGFMLRAIDEEPQLAGARASAAAHPDDWRAQLVLANSAPLGSPEQERALRTAVEENPDSVFAQNGLAGFLLDRGHAEEALPHARRAVELAPGDARIVATLAATAAALGNCDEALVLANRAGDRPGRRGGREPMDARLEHVRSRCPK